MVKRKYGLYGWNYRVAIRFLHCFRSHVAEFEIDRTIQTCLINAAPNFRSQECKLYHGQNFNCVVGFHKEI